MSVESQQAFLKKEGVKEHLDKIIKKVISEKPKDAVGLLEILSRQVKEQALAQQVAQPEKSPEADKEAAAALEKAVQKLRTLDKAPKEDDGETVVTVCEVKNFVEDAEALQWAGVGFGELESYRIMCSLRNLAATAKDEVKSLRFWGKILGTGADYFVAEAKREEGALADGEEEGTDAPGVAGANLNAYYVTTDLTGSWSKLPEIRPKEIVASRSIRSLVTGDLKAKVVTYPYFEGTEEVLLRAQIARISADTTLCIKGFLRTPEETEEENLLTAVEEAGEEFVCPASAELLSLKMWTHMTPAILRSGRTAHPDVSGEPPDADPESGDPVAAAKFARDKAEVESDPLQAILRDLTADGMEWVSKQAGDTTLYRDAVDPKKVKCNAVTFVRSLTWPGAVTVAKGSNFVNLYVGYGLQGGEPDFFPGAPPDIQDEPEERGDAIEPQGEEEVAAEPADGDA